MNPQSHCAGAVAGKKNFASSSHPTKPSSFNHLVTLNCLFFILNYMTYTENGK